MATYVALLRGINVGGHGLIAMKDLRVAIEELPFTNVHTLLQSGNVVFDGAGETGALEKRLEAHCERRLKARPDFMVRTAAEWRSIVKVNPFPAEAESDPGHLLVMALKGAPPKSAVETLRARIVGRERIEARGRELYLVYPDGVGRSKFTGAIIERVLATRGTARNWNTVQKLAALAG